MLIVQIAGGLLGILVAWLMDLVFTHYQNKKIEIQRQRQKIELENYKKSLLKSS